MQATCWPSHNLAVLHWVVNKGWQHLRVMTCLINLIKEGVKDKRVIEERKIRLFTLNMINFGQNVEYVLYKTICVNLYASPVCGCWCVFGPDHSVPGRYSFPAQSGRQLLSLHWSCVARTPWLISLVHCDWLAFPLRGERQDGEGLASHEQGSAALFTQHPTGCTFTMCLIWMLKHRHEVQAERRGNVAPICRQLICVTNATGCWRHSHIWAK